MSTPATTSPFFIPKFRKELAKLDTKSARDGGGVGGGALGSDIGGGIERGNLGSGPGGGVRERRGSRRGSTSRATPAPSTPPRHPPAASADLINGDPAEEKVVPEFGQCVLFTNDEAVLVEEQKRSVRQCRAHQTCTSDQIQLL